MSTKASRASSSNSNSASSGGSHSVASSQEFAGVRTGTPVKVRGGAFCGHTGFIEERKPNRLALVRIEVMGRPVRVEIEPYYLDVLN